MTWARQLIKLPTHGDWPEVSTCSHQSQENPTRPPVEMLGWKQALFPDELEPQVLDQAGTENRAKLEGIELKE